MDTQILREEVDMLDNMIGQVKGQLEEAQANLTKLETVREALQTCVDDDEQLQLKLVED